MPDISRIKLVLNQEDQTFEIKDSELRDTLGTLLGGEEQEDDNQGD